MAESQSGLPLRHLAVLTEYDGSGFFGWQAQARGRTVQQTLARALEELTGESNVQITGSSRTDSGVHARGHVSHFRTRSRIPSDKMPLALNSHLPPDVSVLAACEVDQDFHAQYHAIGKIYSYTIWNHASRPAIDRLRICHIPGPLDLAALRQAMPCLVGRHDFSSFMDTGSCDRSPVRTLLDLTLTVQGPRLVFRFQGDGFLYHMVRILTGTLVAVAQGKISPDELPALLEGRDRTRTGKTMPPQGLCLERVLYDPPLFADFFRQTSTEGENHAEHTLE
jgi:tRNA pseudouridine38-40 synthase